MSCINPIRIKNPRYEGIPPDQWYILYPEFKPESGILPIDYYIDVPCCKCHECAKSKRASWVFRLREEYRTHYPALFITLTFDDKYYNQFFPDNKYHNKPLSLFLDRFRKKYGKQVRHFFIGEFGEDTGRFHYHGIFFNIDYIDVNDLNDLWKYGYTWIGYCSDITINYITKYIIKSTDLNRKIPRIMASPGIGLSFIDSEDGKYLFNREKPLDKIESLTRTYPIPRYIKLKSISEKDRRILYSDYLRDPDSVVYVQGEPYKRNSKQLSKARLRLLETRKNQGFIIPRKNKTENKIQQIYGEH